MSENCTFIVYLYRRQKNFLFWRQYFYYTRIMIFYFSTYCPVSSLLSNSVLVQWDFLHDNRKPQVPESVRVYGFLFRFLYSFFFLFPIFLSDTLVKIFSNWIKRVRIYFFNLIGVLCSNTYIVRTWTWELEFYSQFNFLFCYFFSTTFVCFFFFDLKPHLKSIIKKWYLYNKRLYN